MSRDKELFGPMFFTREECEILYYSLGCRRGIIETGHPNMTAVDAEKSGQKDRIKVLSIEQMKLVVDIDKMMQKFMKGT